MKCKNRWNIYKPPHGWTWKTSLFPEGSSSPGWHFLSYSPGRPQPPRSRSSGTLSPKGYLLHDPTFLRHLKIWWTPFSRFALSFSWFLLRSCSWTSTTIFFFSTTAIKKKKNPGTSLVVQWLRLCTSTAGGTDLIPGQGTVIPSAVHYGQKQKKASFLFHFQHPPKLLSLSPPCRGGCIPHAWPEVWLMWTECLVHTLVYAWGPCSVRLHSWLQTHCSEQK